MKIKIDSDGELWIEVEAEEREEDGEARNDGGIFRKYSTLALSSISPPK